MQVLKALEPLSAVMVSYRFFGTFPNAYSCVGIAVLVVGVVGMSEADASLNFHSVFMALASSFLLPLRNTFAKRLQNDGEESDGLVFFTRISLIGTAATVPVLFFTAWIFESGGVFAKKLQTTAEALLGHVPRTGQSVAALVGVR